MIMRRNSKLEHSYIFQAKAVCSVSIYYLLIVENIVAKCYSFLGLGLAIVNNIIIIICISVGPRQFEVIMDY